MKKLRILALVHKHLVPPDDTEGVDVVNAEWKMEFDVTVTLEGEGHEVLVAGVHDDLTPIRSSIDEFRPDIVFNLLEGFADINTFDQNVVSFLELLRIPYTGCNPRGLILARDKSLGKKLLTYHRVPVPDFSRCHPPAFILNPSALVSPSYTDDIFLPRDPWKEPETHAGGSRTCRTAGRLCSLPRLPAHCPCIRTAGPLPFRSPGHAGASSRASSGDRSSCMWDSRHSRAREHPLPGHGETVRCL